MLFAQPHIDGVHGKHYNSIFDLNKNHTGCILILAISSMILLERP